MKIGIKKIDIVVGPIDQEHTSYRRWSFRIQKYDEKSDIRVSFEGDPTLPEFKEAFNVLAQAEIGSQLKEVIENIERSLTL